MRTLGFGIFCICLFLAMIPFSTLFDLGSDCLKSEKVCHVNKTSRSSGNLVDCSGPHETERMVCVKTSPITLTGFLYLTLMCLLFCSGACLAAWSD